MPELPEVESLRRSLLPFLPGGLVVRARLRRADVARALEGDPARVARPADLLQASTIESLERHGKQLAIVARGSRVLVVRLGMTGGLTLDGPGSRAPDPHVHARWTIRQPSGATIHLAFRDPRRFGGLAWSENPGALGEAWARLGPDALGVESTYLGRATRGSGRAIKPWLLDQSRLAGVGNIYADEALHRAGIRPTRRAGSLVRAELDRLAEAVRGVLGEAIAAGGSTLRDYADAQGSPGEFRARHRVYGRGGLGCLACGTTLTRETLGQRTSVWCRQCQR